MSTDVWSPEYLTHLKDSLIDLFSIEELKELCFEMGIDYEAFQTDAKPTFARELILFAKRRNKLATLVALCERERTDHNWRVRRGGTSANDAASHSQKTAGSLEALPGQSQSARDARALDMVRRQLDLDADPPIASQSDFDSAIIGASREVRATIFRMADQVQSRNWFEYHDKWKMERTIPIFRALIASDSEERYFRNHANLGYALKDMRKPDWKGAYTELTKAINMRGPAEDYGYAIYEFNRAICAIMLEGAVQQKKRSSEKSRKAILDDLRAAAQSGLINLIKTDELLSEWLELNGVRKL